MRPLRKGLPCSEPLAYVDLSCAIAGGGSGFLLLLKIVATAIKTITTTIVIASYSEVEGGAAAPILEDEVLEEFVTFRTDVVVLWVVIVLCGNPAHSPEQPIWLKAYGFK